MEVVMSRAKGKPYHGENPLVRLRAVELALKYTPSGAAKGLGLHRQTIWRWRKETRDGLYDNWFLNPNSSHYEEFGELRELLRIEAEMRASGNMPKWGFSPKEEDKGVAE